MVTWIDKKSIESARYLEFIQSNGINILLGEVVTKGEHVGLYPTLLVFENRYAFDAFFDECEDRPSWMKWDTSRPVNSILLYTSKPLKHRVYKDVGFKVLSEGVITDQKDPIHLCITEDKMVDDIEQTIMDIFGVA